MKTATEKLKFEIKPICPILDVPGQYLGFDVCEGWELKVCHDGRTFIGQILAFPNPYITDRDDIRFPNVLYELGSPWYKARAREAEYYRQDSNTLPARGNEPLPANIKWPTEIELVKK